VLPSWTVGNPAVTQPEETAQESDEIQTDMAEGQEGIRKGFSEHEPESPTDAL